MRNSIIAITIGVFVTILACTPKVAETIEQAVTPPEPKEELVQNPCTTLGELSYAKREEVETAYVLYKDQIKLKNYDEAYKLWKVAYYGAPAANGSVKYQFEDGLTIYKNKYETATDKVLKSSYVDTIMMIYDKRIECYGEPAYVAGRKAFDYYYYYNTEASKDEIYSLFKEAVDAKKEKSDYFVINPFTKILTDKIIAKEIDVEEGRKYTSYMRDAIDYGVASGKNKEAWNIISNYAPARLENLEGIAGLYDCAYFEDKYMALLEENPEDCEIINTVYGRLLWGGCDPTAASVQTAKATKEEKCYTPPPPPGKLRSAYNAYQEGKYYDAVQLFDEYIQNSDDNAKKAKYSLLVAKIYYGDIKDFPKSRKYALQSLDYNPSSGEPYLIIGKLYASSGPLCGPGTGWDSQVVTWVAIDMWEKALSDPLVSDEARKLINTYKQYMPSKGDVFQRTLKAGDSYKVPCWINRTTTIRTAG
jgi:hypothetical protein